VLTTNHFSLFFLPVAAPSATPAAAGTAAAGSTPATTTASRTTIATPASEIIARWARFVNRQTASLQGLTVQAGNGPLHVLALSQFNEAEAPRLAGYFIANDHG
jgi:hypothetical protein